MEENVKKTMDELLSAIMCCAKSINNTPSSDNALTLADACEKLANAFYTVDLVKESEEK